MRAWVFDSGRGLRVETRDAPEPGRGEVLIRIEACGVCRTDLHIIDGELDSPKEHIVPGHQIVGVVERVGADAATVQTGARVGVTWLAWACGSCDYCKADLENLCTNGVFTGYTRDGGFAEYVVADAQFTFPLPHDMDPVQIAPWLCGGVIGYRALRMAGSGRRVGLYGFGSAAHMLTRVLTHRQREVHAFTRPGDEEKQEFARTLGAVWAGGSDERPDHLLDSAIIFAPVGGLVPLALRAVRPAGSVVCAGIHMSDIPSFPYACLWEERAVRSVANLTRRDARDFIATAAEIPLVPSVQVYDFDAADQALADLRAGRLQGSAVLRVASAASGAK